MITEPLFKDNILSNIYSNFAYYFLYYTIDNLYIWFIAGIVFLFCNWVLTKYFFSAQYPDFVPEERYTFDRRNKWHWLGLSVAALFYFVYCANTLWQETSIYNNWDSMSWYYTQSFKMGTMPGLDGHLRFTPLQGIDLNVVWGISNNLYIIYLYIFIKQLLIVWLLYKFFNFMSVPRRLLMIAVVNFVPAVLWINSAIYPEQNIIIFVMLSLIFLRHFQQTKGFRYLLYFMIFMNLALYSKETIAIFYGGYGVYLLLSAVLNGKININSFLHPVKCIRLFPVEYLMFWSLFLFATCWMLLTDFEIGNHYLVTHSISLTEAIRIYQTELMVSVIALVVMLVKFIKGKNWYLLDEGNVIGCMIMSYVIVFRLMIIPSADSNIPYYLYLPAIFCTAYICANIVSSKILCLTTMIVLGFAGCTNYYISAAQQGKERYDMAEYIISRAKLMKMTIYIDVNEQFVDTRWWKTRAWANALSYSYPGIKIKFKLDIDVLNIWNIGYIIPVSVSNQYPIKGDYILVNKIRHPDYVPASDAVIAYENRVYTLYHLE